MIGGHDHPTKILFGKHRGERWTRLPRTYLETIANNTRDPFTAIRAKEELDRRGTETPKMLEISSHSIDRISQLTKQEEWGGTGVYTYLVRLAEEALIAAKGADKVEVDGLIYCFKYGNFTPILVTVFRSNEEINLP